ncbi:MAG: hypothetical protein JWL64_1100 [Frankiales bacterium]|nr:hypothetical protein [Frankiales bacterium]
MKLLTPPPTTAGPAELLTGDGWFDVLARGGEEHWHGALPDRSKTHLARWEDDDATWGEHVTGGEYAAATRQA